MPIYPIEIHSLHIAPEHRVFGRGQEDLSGADLRSMESVKVVADSGIAGDRFCRYRPGYNGHVTFFSREVWDDVSRILDISPARGPELTRRNIIVSGVDLKALYGVEFSLQDIQFFGTRHCSPCPAMNRAIGEGATKALRGRGGLRAQVKSSGTLKVGQYNLSTEAIFDFRKAGEQPASLKLP